MSPPFLNAVPFSLRHSFIDPGQRSILGPIITWYDKLHYLNCAKYIVPMIEQRMEQLAENEMSPSLSYKEPVSPHPLLDQTQEGILGVL